MRLSKIKLSGFKSFVDPVVLDVSANLIGVIGPNGCGKSNIIDALLWVLGESSAKQLRGDSLADVIFNGSSGRSPVGQASVELVLDNSDGTVTGQYAAYNEISIKRRISRDGISHYYLNETRCRRRDIITLFLGTGLGSRSYAIIEQGTISRLIEAKPEDLRSYIEEAAGISKYRVRRQEAINRMRHASENLNRINDIREELDSQLKRLDRQAKVAQRFRELKEEERHLRTESLTLAWLAQEREISGKQERIDVLQGTLEGKRGEQQEFEQSLENARADVQKLNQELDGKQSEFYRISSEVLRLEQGIQYEDERARGYTEELGQIAVQLSQVEEEKEADKKALEQICVEMSQLQPREQEAILDATQADRLLSDAETSWQDWQREWDAWHQSEAELQGERQQVEVRLRYLRERTEELERKREECRQERSQIAAKGLTETLEKVRARCTQLATGLEQCRSGYEAVAGEVRKGREALADMGRELDALRSSQQTLRGQQSSLEVLQEASLGVRGSELQGWLEERGLAERDRLVETVEIESEWTRALESVARDFLGSLCVDDVRRILDCDNATMPDGIGLISSNQASLEAGTVRWPRLIDHVCNDVPLPAYLQHIYTAEDLDSALRMAGEFLPHESAVTRQGVWVGCNWVLCLAEEDGEGMVQREQSLVQLRTQLEALDTQVRALDAREKEAGDALREAERNQSDLHQEIQQFQSELTSESTRLGGLQAEIAQDEMRVERTQRELHILEERCAQESDNAQALEDRLQVIADDSQKMKMQNENLAKSRLSHEKSLGEVRKEWQHSRQQSGGISLQIKTLDSRREALEQALRRIELQLQQIDHRRAEARQSLTRCGQILPGMREKLEQCLVQKRQEDERLSGLRSSIKTQEKNLQYSEQQRLQLDRELRILQTQLEEERVEWRAVQVRMQALEEQLAEFSAEPREVMASLPKDAVLSEWKAKLERIERSIQRLGSVNLAAVEEFGELSERKVYLDGQVEDLEKALDTLKGAINRLDRETRSRFKETFDRLNENLSAIFPQLFGGGHAKLELTSDDLLETGVRVIAHPPGKRNTSIHMLSGGEKALVAVSLIFSIFKLNPAPFCILDEVDAPLDDSNAGRFGEMLTRLSEEVQFIFITHNKITMEIAQKLIGVTMKEAGVSTLVPVDMEHVMKIASNT